MENISGTPEQPIRIQGTNNAVINGNGGEIAFAIVNCEHIIIEGLYVTNAHFGIDVKSTAERGVSPLRNIIIRNNEVYGIDGPQGGHAIAVYGENPHAPISDLVLENNRVHNNRLYWSEALVVNGNIDGFVINSNVVWNNDNIGIDIIGFEGKAGDDPAVDCARNGKVFDNIVFGSSTTGNKAYWSENHNVQGEVWTGRGEGPFGGKYDRCCGGIYVDGGWHIEIYHNFVFDNDLGIEVATEHEPPLVTKDVHVHDNIIASSTGWAGLIFGGYADHLGYTEQCTFTNNILYNNETSIAVQKSRHNIIKNNVIVGGWEAIDFNGEMQANNDFQANCWENTNNDADYFNQLNELPEAQLKAQKISTGLLSDPENGDFTLKNTPPNTGTTWRPDEKYLALYAKHIKAQEKANEAATYLQSKIFAGNVGATHSSGKSTAGEEVSTVDCLTKHLELGGYKEALVTRVLKQTDDLYMVQVIVPYGENAYAQATTTKGVYIA